MGNRSKPETISARVTLSDKKLVEAAAAAERVSVSEYVWGIVLPTTRERVRSDLQRQSSND